MSRWLRELRIIPIALIAVGCLFALKMTGLWFEGGYTLGQRLSRGESITVTTVPAPSSMQLQSPTSPLGMVSAQGQRRSWAQEMFNYPDVTGSVAAPRSNSRDTLIATGSAGSAKESAKTPDKASDKPDNGTKESAAKESAAKDAAKQPASKEPAKKEAPQTKPAAGAERPVDVAARPDPARPSSAERAILERLLERRQELDAKARELELRENLLKAAEKNLEAKLEALKAKETGPNGQRKDEVEAARFKGLVTMYETMKPKEAAKIFDRLDIKVLVEVAGQINPRRMSEIMAQMSPEAAERLTMEFASRGDTEKGQKPADLPKIDGKPAGG
jgi:flagellar motility protein MotE (MotC chaperone)